MYCCVKTGANGWFSISVLGLAVPDFEAVMVQAGEENVVRLDVQVTYPVHVEILQGLHHLHVDNKQ